MKYEDWLAVWLESYVRPSAKACTYERYASLIRLHIAPRLGAYDADGLTPAVLQSFAASLSAGGNLRADGGLSPNTVSVALSVVKNSLRAARLAGVVQTSPAEHLVHPRRTERPVECFTLAEQKKIERAALSYKKEKMRGVVLCLYTGLRLGELLALTWADVDLKKGVLTVAASCHDGRGGRVTEAPKTPSSRRVIPLPKQLLPLLRAWKKGSASPCLVAEDGNPVSVRSYQRSFQLLLRRLHIPHRGFHALRHTFATRALECGMDVKTLSEILGNKNATVTLNRYAHSLLEHKASMMNRLGKLL